MLLSLCMIVKNEDKVLERCLASVRNVVDEIIIVDTGSSDGSEAIAKSHNAKLFSFNWIDDFSAARNYALKQASGDWILHLDADEELDNKSAVGLREQLKSSDKLALEVIVRNHQPVDDMVRFSDDRQLRLFPNRKNITYRNRVHEQIAPAVLEAGCKISASPVIIDHYGYMDANAPRLQRNLGLLLAEQRQKAEDGYLRFKLGETYKGLGQWDAAEENLARALNIFKSTHENELKGQIHLRLAQIALLKNDYSTALEHADAAISLKHESDLAGYIKGIALMYTGQSEKAFQLFKNLIKNDTGQVDLSDVKKLLQALEAVT